MKIKTVKMNKPVKMSLKAIVSVVLICLLLGIYGYFSFQSSLSNWGTYHLGNKAHTFGWSKFIWTNDSISGKYFEKSAIMIPAKIEGIDNVVTFQFDLGVNHSVVYENNLSSFYVTKPALSKNVEKFGFPINLISSNKMYKNLSLSLSGFYILNKSVLVYDNYGEKYPIDSLNKTDTIHIGTIGTDLLKDKILIIDYPKQQFTVCDELPSEFNKNLFPIELDRENRVILPLTIKGKTYRILFDTGSSLFPIICSSNDVKKYSTNSITDSIEISSWGEKHWVYSRMISDSFNILGKNYSNVKVYENHTGKGMASGVDGMIGNYLVWNNIVVIDFKNKKMAIN
jgi:hypothetical protein